MDLRGTLFFHLHQLRETFDRSFSTLCTHFIAFIKGIKIDKGLSVKGIPYFYRTPHSIISIGCNCSILSSYHSNNIGSMCRSRICTQTPEARIEIGNHVGMSSVTITAHQSVAIDDETMIGAGTVITDCNWHCLSTDATQRHTNAGKSSPIRIGKNVFIGTHCIILKGVTIGDNAVIGAGSVVTTDVPANTLAAGNPCKNIRTI